MGKIIAKKLYPTETAGSFPGAGVAILENHGGVWNLTMLPDIIAHAHLPSTRIHLKNSAGTSSFPHASFRRNFAGYDMFFSETSSSDTGRIGPRVAVARTKLVVQPTAPQQNIWPSCLLAYVAVDCLVIGIPQRAQELSTLRRRRSSLLQRVDLVCACRVHDYEGQGTSHCTPRTSSAPGPVGHDAPNTRVPWLLARPVACSLPC